MKSGAESDRITGMVASAVAVETIPSIDPATGKVLASYEKTSPLSVAGTAGKGACGAGELGGAVDGRALRVHAEAPEGDSESARCAGGCGGAGIGQTAG